MGDDNSRKVFLDDIFFCGLTVATPTATPTESPIHLAPPVPPPVDPPTPSPNNPPTLPPVAPVTPSPTYPPTNLPARPCCPADYTGLRAWNNCHQYYHCVNGIVTGGLLDVPAGTLFDQNLQNVNWADQVTCIVDNCTQDPTPSPTPVSPTVIPDSDPCCPANYTGLRAWNNCYQYYHCVNGIVTGDLLSVPAGTLFDQNLQNNNWANQVTCVVDC